MHLFSLALDFNHGVADLLDQVMNALHGAIEHLPQLPQLVATAGLEINRHVARGHLVHYRTEGLERMAGRGIKAAVEVDDQQEHAGQRRHQHDHVQAVLGQTLLQ
ncbi:hypothetical protein D3C80_1363960 [compost metagenome]